MKTNKLEYIDYVKSIAIISVIFIHVSAIYVNNYQVNTIHWQIGNIADSFARIAVPLFFMASGALLLNNDKYKNFSYIKSKFLNKLVIPFLLWSLFYFFITIASYVVTNQENKIVDYILQVIFFSKPTYYHLWFMYAYFAIFIFVPVLHKIDDNLKLIYIVIGIIFSSIFVSINQIYNFTYQNYFGEINIYIVYFLLGYLLNKQSSKIKPLVLLLLYILLSLIIIMITYNFSMSANKFIDFFYKNSSPLVFIQTITIFLFFKQTNFSKVSNKLKYVVEYLSKNSFGIYLMHIIFIKVIEKLHLYKIFFSNVVYGLLYICLLAFGILLFTLVISTIIRKFKLSKMLLG